MSRARVITWYALVLFVVLGAFGGFVVWQQRRIGAARTDRAIEALSTTLESLLRDELMENGNPTEAAQEVCATITAPDRAVGILEGDRRVLAAAWNGLDTNPGGFREHRRAVSIGGRQYVLVAAMPVADMLREQRSAVEAMIVAFPVVLLLAIAGGWWMASHGPVVVRLRETLRVQRQFMADASHELRTPLSVIKTATDVALSRERRDAEDYRETVAMISTEARRLSQLVDDMLVLARADAGGYPLHTVHLYLNDLVEECRRAVDVLAAARGVRVQTAIPADIPLTGDENLLRRMLLNVVQNAVTHTRPGGLVSIDVAADATWVAIRVRDEGEGIAETDSRRIFDRFVQLDASRHNAGAGLGLPIARWIAEAHGGRLELEASCPAGSTFLIELPIPAARA